MLNFFWVFLGGGLGSICRYGIAQLLAHLQFEFPLATLLANFISCMVLGFLISIHLKEPISPTLALLFMTGFCGGFSTFSTFSAETFLLFEANNWEYAFGNIVISLVVCLVAIYIGMKIGQSW